MDASWLTPKQAIQKSKTGTTVASVIQPYGLYTITFSGEENSISVWIQAAKVSRDCLGSWKPPQLKWDVVFCIRAFGF
jgi:hypothetical protein